MSEHDAVRRTRLANERTYLAWYRTGLTSLAVGVGIGRVLPEVSDSASRAFELVGAGYALLGIGFIAAGFYRARAVEEAVDEGGYAGFSASLSLALVVAGVVLGVATFLLVVFT